MVRQRQVVVVIGHACHVAQLVRHVCPHAQGTAGKPSLQQHSRAAKQRQQPQRAYANTSTECVKAASVLRVHMIRHALLTTNCGREPFAGSCEPKPKAYVDKFIGLLV